MAGAYTVNLNSKPADTVTVTIGGSTPAVSLSGHSLTNNQLTFTTTNWNTAQTITITPVKDDNAVGETITLTHTLSGGDYAGIAADSVTVNLIDSDTRNMVLSKQSLTVTEEDTTGDRYTVKLATQPSDTVTVTVSGHDGADLTLIGTALTNNQLTFTTTNWGTAQTVTVKAGGGDNSDNESETLAHTAFGGDYINITKDLPVTVTDDDVPQVNSPPTASDGTVTTDEDAVHTFTAANFSYSDTDNDPLSSVKIIELPAAGALTLNGTAITSTDLPKTVTAAQLTGGALKYAPPANANGAAYASFKFKVNDGTEDSAAEYLITINVTAVNDPATGIPTISGTAQVGQTLTASTARHRRSGRLPSTFTYPWKRYAADRTTFEANIGTNLMTHTLTASEEGKKVLVEVSFRDNGGASEGPLVSALYPASGTVQRITVSFGADAYTGLEGDTQSVTVTLSANPERTVTIPLTATNQGDAAPRRLLRAVERDLQRGRHVEDDHFQRNRRRGGRRRRERAARLRDTAERGERGNAGRSHPTNTGRSQAIVRNTDDQEVTVSFGTGAYTVAEGETQLVTVNLSTELEDTVVIPLTATNQYGATAANYSGVPSSVTFNSGETTKPSNSWRRRTMTHPPVLPRCSPCSRRRRIRRRPGRKARKRSTWASLGCFGMTALPTDRATT